MFSPTRAQRLLDSQTTAVLVFDGAFRLSDINPAGEMLIGHSGRQYLGCPVQELFEAAGVLPERLARALEAASSYTEHELVLRLRSGKRITVDCVITPLVEPGRQPELLVELQQIDRHLRISREEALLEQHQATRQLVRGLAHEIKNPLGGLRGAAQLLARELEREDLREYTRIIIEEADRLRELVNRMLGPNNAPRKERINIHQVVERVASLIEAEGHDGLALQRDYDPSIPELHADPALLIQALLNVARNAVEALDGRGRITLRTRALRQFTIGSRRHRLVASVEIIDDGPGIPEDMKDSLFYPMVTGRAEGTGLGLSIAQSLVNLHDGLIECESEPGETRFTVLLPLEPSHD